MYALFKFSFRNIYQKLNTGILDFVQIDVILDVRKPIVCCTKCSKKSLCVLVQNNDVSKTCTLYRIDVTIPNIKMYERKVLHSENLVLNTSIFVSLLLFYSERNVRTIPN